MQRQDIQYTGSKKMQLNIVLRKSKKNNKFRTKPVKGKDLEEDIAYWEGTYTFDTVFNTNRPIRKLLYKTTQKH